MTRILIACEYSGRVRRRFRKMGHDAWSCDLREDMYYSVYHIRRDVREILNDGWDGMVAFPPCTYLSNAGNAWRQEWEELGYCDEALDFVRLLMDAPIPRIAIENPVGLINSRIRKPDQIIEPYMFGDPYYKRTCLWLKRLPRLRPTREVQPLSHWVSGGSNHGALANHHKQQRDLTFPGIAQAMATQWGKGRLWQRTT